MQPPNPNINPLPHKELWSPDLLFGIPKIDREHRILIECIDDFLRAIKEGRGNETIQTTLHFLENFTDLHFQNEERMMEEIQFSERSGHIKLHQTFRDNLLRIKKNLEEHIQSQQATVQLRFLLFTWYTNHIKGVDKKYVNDCLEKQERMPKKNLHLWSEKLVLGNTEIDREHKSLVEIIEELVQAISQKKHYSKGLIASTTRFLQNYTDLHFSHEENLLEKIRYPYLEEQQQLHRQFTDTIRDVTQFVRQNPQSDEALQKIQTILVTWLVDHISKEDHKIISYLA